MLRRLSEGLLEDVEGLRSINAAVASADGKHLPYVRIERKDGTETHVYATEEPLDDAKEARRIAMARAEQIIRAATEQAPPD